MPNDAKLGLVLGVGLVIAVAVVFFHKGGAAASGENSAIPAINPGTAPPAAPEPPPADGNRLSHPVQAQTVLQDPVPVVVEHSSRQHTVKEGDTLFTLAQRYYGDGDRFADLYRANRQVLETPDRLEPGTVLVIPAAP